MELTELGVDVPEQFNNPYMMTGVNELACHYGLVTPFISRDISEYYFFFQF